MDYYPGGSILPGRSFSSNSYRYGYQGSEKDDEINGTGNSYTTHFRQLDIRLGRWWGVDPKASKFPGLSPYLSMDGNPILMNDVLGDIAWKPEVDKQGNVTYIKEKVDDFKSFMKQFDVSRNQAMAMFLKSGAATRNKEGILEFKKLSVGDKVRGGTNLLPLNLKKEVTSSYLWGAIETKEWPKGIDQHSIDQFKAGIDLARAKGENTVNLDNVFSINPSDIPHSISGGKSLSFNGVLALPNDESVKVNLQLTLLQDSPNLIKTQPNGIASQFVEKGLGFYRFGMGASSMQRAKLGYDWDKHDETTNYLQNR